MFSIKNPSSLKKINKIINYFIKNQNIQKKCYTLCELSPLGIYFNNYDLLVCDKKLKKNSLLTTIKVVEFFPENLNKQLVINNDTNCSLYLTTKYDYLILYPVNLDIDYDSKYPLMENSIILLPSYYLLLDGKLPKHLKVKNIKVNPVYYDLYLYNIVHS